MSDLRDKRVDLILQQLEDLPTLPAVATRLLELTGNIDSKVSEVVRLIESDPSLSARILQLVHRAGMGVRGGISSVERAVVLLGFDAVRSAVLAVSVFDTFKSVEPKVKTPLDREALWKHSLAVACCAELLAEKLPGGAKIDASEAFVCGLLHDIGKIAFDAALPKSFARVVEAADTLRGDIADIERNVIGLDHMVAGKRLAERWNLPATIRECAWLHGQMPDALPATVRSARLVNLISLSDMLAREHHLGYSGNYSFATPRDLLLNATGITQQQIDDAITELVDRIHERSETLGLGRAQADSLYRDALARANQELLRANSQLTSKNSKLATRARFFEALAAFQGELRPDAPPQQVLRAIAHTALATLGVDVCSAFSIASNREWAECVVVNADDQVVNTSLIDIPPDDRNRQTTTPGMGPVLAADDSLNWLMDSISPRLSRDQRFWICLHADGVQVGGVVWGNSAGEAQRLATQTQELTALAAGWSLALRTSQIREEARSLSEQLAESNRQLQNAQSEILRSRTLTTVGEMAAGAAHEMNNPLAVISGRSQLLSQQLEDPKLKSAAQLVYEQSQRLSDIITELMDFAKPAPPRLVEVDPIGLLHNSLQEAKAGSDPADRKFELTFGDAPVVRVDPNQVTAALREIIVNAIQATDERSGLIEIHAGYDSYSQRVVVTISDNGGGMDEQTLKRAFDPFYSAKRAGRRRGMGLAKALRWVESSGGSIRLESLPGKGTKSIVLLPAAANENSASVPDARKHA